MDETSKQCHLSFIQNIISRMAGNSFLLRGWSVTIVAAIFSLAANDADNRLIVISYYSALLFWTMDSYYIRQEKLFRKLYEDVAQASTNDAFYRLDTGPVATKVPTLIQIFFAKNTIVFHLPIILLITISMIFFRSECNDLAGIIKNLTSTVRLTV